MLTENVFLKNVRNGARNDMSRSFTILTQTNTDITIADLFNEIIKLNDFNKLSIDFSKVNIVNHFNGEHITISDNLDLFKLNILRSTEGYNTFVIEDTCIHITFEGQADYFDGNPYVWSIESRALMGVERNLFIAVSCAICVLTGGIIYSADGAWLENKEFTGLELWNEYLDRKFIKLKGLSDEFISDAENWCSYDPDIPMQYRAIAKLLNANDYKTVKYVLENNKTYFEDKYNYLILHDAIEQSLNIVVDELGKKYYNNCKGKQNLKPTDETIEFIEYLLNNVVNLRCQNIHRQLEHITELEEECGTQCECIFDCSELKKLIEKYV